MDRVVKAKSLKEVLNSNDAPLGLGLFAGDKPIVQIQILPKEENKRTYTIFWRGTANIDQMQAWAIKLSEFLFDEYHRKRKDVGVLASYYYEDPGADGGFRIKGEQNLIWFPWPDEQSLTVYDKKMHALHADFLAEMGEKIYGLVTYRIKATFWHNDFAILQTDIPGKNTTQADSCVPNVSFNLSIPCFPKALILQALLQTSASQVNEKEAEKIMDSAEKYLNQFYRRYMAPHHNR